MTGNTFTDSARIIRTFDVPSGSRYSDEAVKRGIRKLFALGLFADIRVDQRPRPGAVDLVIVVAERPRVASVAFSGNQKRETAELERKVALRAGSIYSPTAVQTQIDSLLRYYRDEGFPQATVRAVADSAGPNQVALRFEIHEGERVRITRIRFEGASAFPAKRLRKQLKSKQRGFFGGGEVKEENLVEDRTRLEAWYHNHGYRDMRWLGHELVPGDGPRRLTLVVRLEEGPSYSIGSVTWSGHEVVDGATLAKLWAPKAGERYDASRIEKAQGAAYAEYAERGYLSIGIEPRETVRDRVVDVHFAVAEGQPSAVRFVHITGNKATREKVIRREMTLHEGERFKRSALQRTQGEIFRLGLFEDVQIELAPADSTDVDVVLKVKEKQVGTASAGAGYTSESGLTGFLELGHNNVLGNGQSLNLHLERGGRRSDYYVSFTEPWFRDTPTLLGFSAFNTERERDLYEERRVGGSGRIGRPLPWPDYSRGSLSYRLENVKLDSLGVLDLATRTALADLFGERNLTSSLETSFSRNSTDNPFYPTRGTRLTVNDEFAGGPFGGSVHFHKHRIEGRAYVPSVIRGVTTMLKARLGLIGKYRDQSAAVPAYERFRLGGGSTIDPLRGYDDYDVVPRKNMLALPNYRTVLDSTSTPGRVDTLRVIDSYGEVRYPGGHFALVATIEQQFPVVHPLHGVLFFDAGNVWDQWSEIKPWDLKLGAGIGFRFEIPLLGNIGFDYAYGFHNEDFDPATGRFQKRARFRGHFLLGNVNF